MIRPTCEIRDEKTAVITIGKCRYLFDTDAMLVRGVFDECQRQGALFFVLNMEGVESPTAQALGILIAMLTSARDKKGNMVLCNVGEKVQNLLTITKLQNVFEVYDSVELAVTQLS